MLSTHRLTFAEGEDSAQVVVRFDNGAIGTLWTSWAYDPPEITERFSVVAENGTLHSDGTSLHVRYRSGETSSQTYEQGGHLRRRDRPLRRLLDQRHPSAAHREGGHRGARDDPGRATSRLGPRRSPRCCGPRLRGWRGPSRSSTDRCVPAVRRRRPDRRPRRLAGAQRDGDRQRARSSPAPACSTARWCGPTWTASCSGAGSNLQDNVVVHTDYGFPTWIGVRGVASATPPSCTAARSRTTA